MHQNFINKIGKTDKTTKGQEMKFNNTLLETFGFSK